jgi:hypothetical protein
MEKAVNEMQETMRDAQATYPERQCVDDTRNRTQFAESVHVSK